VLVNAEKRYLVAGTRIREAGSDPEWEMTCLRTHVLGVSEKS
jgi:hypothetical protein